MNENAITQKVIGVLNGIADCRAKKRHGGKFQSGEPDIAGCFNGQAFFIEVKLKGGELTKLQATELDKWQDSRAKTAVAVWMPESKNFYLVTADQFSHDRWIDRAGPASDMINRNEGSTIFGWSADDWVRWLAD